MKQGTFVWMKKWLKSDVENGYMEIFVKISETGQQEKKRICILEILYRTNNTMITDVSSI